MTSSSESAAGRHILVFPYPAQGHMLPLLDLTHHILTRGGSALTATVVVTPKNLPILQPLLSIHPPSIISALVLPFPTHPSLPSGAENIQDLPPHSFLAVMSSLQRLRRPLIQWFYGHPSPPSVILSDFFLGWTQRVAAELGIKRIVFSPSGAFAVSVADAIWRSLPPPSRSEDGTVDENAVVLTDDLPGQPRFLWYQLSLLYRTYASGEPGSEFIRVEWEDNSASWGWVINSFADLERPYLSHLRTRFGQERIWAVGPVLPPDGKVGCVRGGGPGPTDDHVLAWLDTCGDEEVVYVCFGSQAVLRNEHMEVLVLGLETSGARFVWRVKEPSQGHVSGDSFGKLPPGFEDRVAGRGLILREWAPQVSILRHRAVGAFLTHCGWNSVLEGLSAGTIMLTWPLGADQFINSELLVEQLKAGVRVSRNDRSLPDPHELAQVISRSVSGAYKEERSRALAEMKKMAADAVTVRGSSTLALDTLVKHLSKLPKPDADVSSKKLSEVATN
ncbi:hypothetical protein V2J09_011464 [Rumex salicifolius]